MTVVTTRAIGEYERRRRRANDLAERWAFATEVLTFYTRLLDVQEPAFDEARTIDASEAAAFAAERVAPRIVEASVSFGPPALQQGVLERFDSIDLHATVSAWLQGEPLGALERFLARASSAPVLEALGSRAGDACAGPRDDRHCPACGGSPQLAYAGNGDEDLVTPHRYLECSRCAASWPFARMICAACGENDTAKLLRFSEIGALEAETSGQTVRGSESHPELVEGQPQARALLPHVSIEGCDTCKHYVLSVDVRRDPRAVPQVDELAALPLYLYASERGLNKIVANALGF
ncbi:MAG TPA: formate dehydrogenase accessory protein FdhE [Candidatus Baltobacteraceae bacterium]|nr:formate dehydrogenase accessory protein FdhE [Candidatus Baltobacteraceae bacterium]